MDLKGVAEVPQPGAATGALQPVAVAGSPQPGAAAGALQPVAVAVAPQPGAATGAVAVPQQPGATAGPPQLGAVAVPQQPGTTAGPPQLGAVAVPQQPGAAAADTAGPLQDHALQLGTGAGPGPLHQLQDSAEVLLEFTVVDETEVGKFTRALASRAVFGDDIL